ncbi:hypothetical protein SAMN05216201_10989 [Pseudomonas linyingensis]|uniref:Uncharacterized protein n=1 Tax=Pseudomonas linyingensis TaxID=915471 RepID=A0A1H6YZV9_9PSED|nr:hypothetical protein [Pseudomonas linyingensis]SEJ46749.1 hypothetical protein SAMN05216201_10989 [Pseudomonas linyingensis]
MNTQELAESLSPELPGCPLATIRDMLRWAQRELCAEGNVWIVRDGPVVVAANTPYAEVEAPAGAEALRIIRLLLDGRPLRPGVDYRQHDTGVEFLCGMPDSSTLLGAIACRPAYGQDMPAELIARWEEALLDGARYRLLRLPQPWRDPELAEFHRRRFLDAQSDARQMAVDGMQHGSIRMRTRRFT